MASWVTHLWVADEVLKRFPKLDKVKPVSQKMFRVI